jgi:hypothetical protein
MPHLECPRCATKIHTRDYPTLGECPYCLARGVYPVPFLRRSSLFRSVPRLATERLDGEERIGAEGQAGRRARAG